MQEQNQQEISKFQQAYEELKQKLESIRVKAEEELRLLREKAKVYGAGAEEFIDSVGRYVKENPQRSSIIAILIGFVIGLLLGLLIKKNND
ncbi:MAG: hypothetical protein NZ853_03365 [Leptospiraceae bacterium]|nr:hypothetical protein [Leptospiraceae bacterium]MDW7975212.1 hypothetical protein [Leptospiraceae bacterium]